MVQRAGFSIAEILHEMDYELTVSDLDWASQYGKCPAKIAERLLQATRNPAVVLGACAIQALAEFTKFEEEIRHYKERIICLEKALERSEANYKRA